MLKVKEPIDQQIENKALSALKDIVDWFMEIDPIGLLEDRTRQDIQVLLEQTKTRFQTSICKDSIIVIRELKFQLARFQNLQRIIVKMKSAVILWRFQGQQEQLIRDRFSNSNFASSGFRAKSPQLDIDRSKFYRAKLNKQNPCVDFPLTPSKFGNQKITIEEIFNTFPDETRSKILHNYTKSLSHQWKANYDIDR